MQEEVWWGVGFVANAKDVHALCGLIESEELRLQAVYWFAQLDKRPAEEAYEGHNLGYRYYLNARGGTYALSILYTTGLDSGEVERQGSRVAGNNEIRFVPIRPHIEAGPYQRQIFA